MENITKLSEEQLELVTEKQREMQERFLSVSDDGKIIEYLGKEFIVYKNVFWPFEDSKPLVENYKVNPGEIVLDICSGSGVIAIFSAFKGAKKVIALDISPDAIKTAKANVQLHNLDEVVEIRLSDMFEALRTSEKFDVITGNLPFRKIDSVNSVEATMWDTDLKAHKKFFEGVKKHLKLNGRVYLAQANFGAIEEMKHLAETSGFFIKLIGQRIMPYNDPRIFYAFELNRK